MKKIISLILALALLLTAFGALAESAVNSKQEPVVIIEFGPTVPAQEGDPNAASSSAAAETTTNNNNNNAGTAATTGTTDTEVVTPTITLKIIGDTDESKAFIDSVNKGGDASAFLAALPTDILAQIPADAKKLNEAGTAQFEGDVNDVITDMTVITKFQTPYEAGTTVTVLFASLPDLATWYSTEGTVLEDGRVQFVVSAAMVSKFGTNPFLYAIVSK